MIIVGLIITNKIKQNCILLHLFTPKYTKMDMPKIGEYTIIKTLGSGKFGIVYLVETTVDKQAFAIKTIKVT